MSAQISEPTILTEKTFFYHPAFNASGRRRSENKQHSIVKRYFEDLGFKVTRSDGEYTGAGIQHVKFGKVEVLFYYTETCKNVYKTLSVTRDGKASNITLLRKIAAEYTIKTL